MLLNKTKKAVFKIKHTLRRRRDAFDRRLRKNQRTTTVAGIFIAKSRWARQSKLDGLLSYGKSIERKAGKEFQFVPNRRGSSVLTELKKKKICRIRRKRVFTQPIE